MSHRMIGILLVLCCVVIEAIGQICFKRAANHAHGSTNGLSTLKKVFGRWPWIGMGVGCFGVEWGFWTLALSLLPVSIAQPMASIELVVVALLSRMFLREKVGPRRIAGIALILFGTILVGLS